MTCGAGALGQLFYEEGATALGDFASGATTQEFISETLKATHTQTVGPYIRGYRSRVNDATRYTQQAVSGSIVIPLSSQYADRACRLGIGGSASPWTPANALPSFGVLIDRVTARYVYAGCVVNEVIFRGQQGGLCEIELGIIGKSETYTTSASGVTASFGTDSGYAPFVLSDLTYSIGGTTTGYGFSAFEIRVNNAIDAAYYNSVTASDLCPQDREVTVSLTGSHGNNHALHNLSRTAETAITLTLTNTDVSVAFAMTYVRPMQESGTIPGRQTIPYTFKGIALADTAAGAEITVTTDITPAGP